MQGTYVVDREIEKIVNFWRAAHKPAVETPPAPARPAVPLRPATSEDDSTMPAAERYAAVQPATGKTPVLASAGDWGATSSEPFLPLPESVTGTLSAEEQDALLPQAIRLVRQHERASASLLQRRLRIGYSQAAQLIDLLEQRGIVGPAKGGRSREVLEGDDRPAAG